MELFIEFPYSICNYYFHSNAVMEVSKIKTPLKTAAYMIT